MVFSSIPAYLDPTNWQQQQNHHQIIGSSIESNPLLPPPPPHAPPYGGLGPGSVRPGSMAERARTANIPLPEQALKCPRCDSTNTKFCYFNNYSLSQPRHFCKTCRRYWTRGGALRTVPVGGGSRRNNKKSKSSSRSKSPTPNTDRETANTADVTASTDISYNNNMLGLPQLRFTESFSGDQHVDLSGYGVITTRAGPADGDFGHENIIEPWRLQQHQFPSPAGTHPNYQFHGESSFVAAPTGQFLRPKFSSSTVKTEERPPHEMNLSRRLLGGLMPYGNEPWSNNNNNNNDVDNNNNNLRIEPNWNELARFSSSSTGNPL